MHNTSLKTLAFACGLAISGSTMAIGIGGGDDDNGGGGSPVDPPASCPTEVDPILPQGATDYYADRPGVPNGEVEVVRASGERFHVYTPPGYSESDPDGYPVLYLSHGGGQDDSNWTSREEDWGGSADLILDNAIAEGRIDPMVVVMPDTSGCAGLSPVAPGGDRGCQDLFRDTLIPYVEANYNVRANRDNRALAGLSQGVSWRSMWALVTWTCSATCSHTVPAGFPPTAARSSVNSATSWKIRKPAAS